MSQAIADVKTYAVSPPGSPHPYGYFPPVTIRTLAFGLIPAEATIGIAQLRQTVADVDPDDTSSDRDGKATEDVPVPWTLAGPAATAGGQVLDGMADVQILRLTLDGQAVAVGTKCHVSSPARVHLNADGAYLPALGGNLSGTIDVPSFTGCGTNGEDLSPLITSMVSGTGNTLEVKQSTIAPLGTQPSNIPSPFPLPER